MFRFGSGGESSNKVVRLRNLLGADSTPDIDDALDLDSPESAEIDDYGVDLRDGATSIFVSPTFALSPANRETRSLAFGSSRAYGAARSKRYENLSPEQAAEAIFNDLSAGKIEAVEDGLRYYERRPHIEPRGFIKAAEKLNASFWYAVSAAYKQQAMRERIG